GGQDYQDTIVYDSGTTTITVNNHTTPYTWSGSTTTAASIAWGLCRAINNDGGAYVYASTNGTLTECPLGGTTISLKAKVPGGTRNYKLTASSTSHQY